MKPSAILLGSIGSVAETTEVQRRAFNAAFAEAGLDWDWAPEPYYEMLKTPGGKRRIADYAAARGETVDAEAIHAAKVRHFERLVREGGIAPRAGVRALIEAARAANVAVGFVTGTTPETVGLILAGLDPALTARDFDVITDVSMISAPKPDPAAYVYALERLKLEPEQALAIEDTPETARAAIDAGIVTIGFPNAACTGRAFPGTIAVTDTLDPALLDTELEDMA